jgi:hypothetical protein
VFPDEIWAPVSEWLKRTEAWAIVGSRVPWISARIIRSALAVVSQFVRVEVIAGLAEPV